MILYQVKNTFVDDSIHYKFVTWNFEGKSISELRPSDYLDLNLIKDL